MRVPTIISIPDQEVEVSVSMEDIVAAIREETGSFMHVLQGINDFAQFFKAIPDEMIVGFGEAQRNLIADFLHEQSIRFTPE